MTRYCGSTWVDTSLYPMESYLCREEDGQCDRCYTSDLEEVIEELKERVHELETELEQPLGESLSPPGPRSYASYNGLTGIATYTAGNKTFGPVSISIPDFHVISRALEESRKEGAEVATQMIKQQMDVMLDNVFRRY